MTLKGITLVGVGPGDPSLLTLAAIKAINEATVIAYPVAQKDGTSIAAEIAAKWIAEDKRRIPLVFPMVLEPKTLQDAWAKATQILIDEVFNGENVAFLSQGDVSLFSTSSYVLLDLLKNYPECPIKLIPGVSSIAAAAAEGMWPLAFQKDQLLIAPTPDDSSKLEELIEEASSKRRVLVLLKLGDRWSWVQPLLDQKGLLNCSLLIQKVGLTEQKVAPANTFKKGSLPYFSLLLVRQSWPEIMPLKR